MAVIITDMDMPLTCEKCEYPKCVLYKTSWYTVGNDSLNYTTERYRDCPLKSTDGMIAEIEHMVFRPYEGRDMLDRNDVINIIHKYCDKEQNNDTQRSD